MKSTIKTQRVERCQVAEILSEPKRLTDVDYKRKNHEQLRKKQEENRRKKEETLNPPKEPFKIKRFQKVQSLVYKSPEEQKQAKTKPKKQVTGGPTIVTYNPEYNPEESKNYIKENARAAVEAEPPRENSKTQENAQSLNPNYGKVPKYLEDFKQEQHQKDEVKRLKEEQAKCPSGMRLMPEQERVETLRMLEVAREETFQGLNKLPIASNTQQVAKRRNEYEKKLNEIEDAIKTFSRPKVYVAID